MRSMHKKKTLSFLQSQCKGAFSKHVAANRDSHLVNTDRDGAPISNDAANISDQCRLPKLPILSWHTHTNVRQDLKKTVFSLVVGRVYYCVSTD